MRTLVLPICGESIRYNRIPKWNIEFHGKKMLEHSISLLDTTMFDDILVIMLEQDKDLDTFEFEHNTTYLSHHTKNQPETVYHGTKGRGGQIVVKDCDNIFRTPILNDNFVSYYDIRLHKVNANNKSYVEVNEYGYVTNIVEKMVVSNFFCCGMYSFINVGEYRKYYEQLANFPTLFLSDIIFKMIMDNHVFYSIPATHYVDWGTKKDLDSYLGNSQ